MAPKEPFKVHSLSKHIENTKKGLSADSQLNRRPTGRSAVVKKESSDPNNIFANNDDEEGSGSDSDSDSSSDEATGSFLERLTAGAKSAPAKPTPVKSTPQAARRRSKDEEIADSDDERKASNNKASTKKPAPKPSSSSDSSSESESDDEETNTKANGTTPAKDADSSSSSSESESESEKEDEKKTLAAKPSARKKDDSDSSSSEESEDEAESKPKPTANGTAAATTSASSSSSSESSSESESEEEQAAKPTTKTVTKPAAKSAATVSDSSSSEDEDSDDEMVDESMHIEDREGQVAVPNFIAPDFILRKGDDGTNGKDVAEVCNKANLEGKQFWYFTVPSDVPISVIQNLEIPMNQSSANNKLFSHGGDDYGFSFESIAPKSNIQIMIPSSDASQYRPAPKQIDQMMQVKKITQLGANSSVGPIPKPAPRAQPAGLKARYQPIGVNEPMGTISDGEDVEMAEAPAVSTKSTKKEKKRKSKETPETKQKKMTLPERPSPQTVEEPTPDTRKNKRKLAASEDDATAVTEQLQAEARSAAKKSKKQKTDRVGSPDLGSEPASVAAKKQTPILPPTIPTAGTPTPKAAVTPAASSKKQKKVKETPLPAPRQSVVPIPSIPHSSPPRSSPAPAPASQAPSSPIRAKEKRVKKSKDSKKTASSKKETPVLPPVPGSSSE
ncbi:hypothetical protein FSPOR_3993 [Fusarium sporotrichioides]|uniref:Uncharacterized protein n=1 Tax=Fusarium sporotrichioides TaxID=5514 RepID=A0A395SDC4_FUSSP|nr:hypothetical protein FSPOR_3993 [Fusarium sporotrichioides]